MGINLREVKGSGPAGASSSADIEAFVEGRAKAPVAPETAAAQPAVEAAAPAAAAQPALHPRPQTPNTPSMFTGLRQTIGKRMTESKQPHRTST